VYVPKLHTANYLFELS